MKGMKSYYVSRAAISAGFGALFVLGGSAWWVGVLVGVLAFCWFLLAPRIGRYVVNPQGGITALQRDERAQDINNTAARNAFVISMLGVAGVMIYAEMQSLSSIPVVVLQWLLILGVAVYYLSDFWLRRTQA